MNETSGHDDQVQPEEEHDDAVDPDDSALPSHSDLYLSFCLSSERERRFLGKFLNYYTGFSASAVDHPLSSDTVET